MTLNHHASPIRAVFALIIMVALAAGLATGPSSAAEDGAAKLSSDDIAAIKRVSRYFNNLNSVKGEFVQVGPGTYLSEGLFYLDKPGKLRFEYADPNPLLVVADGTWVIVNNRQLKTAEHYPIAATPLRMVLAENVSLLEEANIIHVYQDPKLLTVTLEDKGLLVPGQLTLVFDNEKMELQQWVIIDPQGNQITISLKNVAKSVEPDPSLFRVKVPRKFEGRDR